MSILSRFRRSATTPAIGIPEIGRLTRIAELMAHITELEERNEELIRGNENLYLENKLFKSLIHRFYHKQPADG